MYGYDIELNFEEQTPEFKTLWERYNKLLDDVVERMWRDHFVDGINEKKLTPKERKKTWGLQNQMIVLQTPEPKPLEDFDHDLLITLEEFVEGVQKGVFTDELLEYGCLFATETHTQTIPARPSDILSGNYRRDFPLVAVGCICTVLKKMPKEAVQRIVNTILKREERDECAPRTEAAPQRMIWLTETEHHEFLTDIQTLKEPLHWGSNSDEQVLEDFTGKFIDLLTGKYPEFRADDFILQIRKRAVEVVLREGRRIAYRKEKSPSNKE